MLTTTGITWAPSLLLTDKTNARVWEVRYKAFGERDIITSAIANHFGFPGQYYDSESGLWQNWNRDYDQNTGRYVESDPIGLNGGVNAYLYVLANPLTFVDPLGKSSMDCLYLSGDDLAECVFEEYFPDPRDIDPDLGCITCDDSGLYECILSEGPSASFDCGVCIALRGADRKSCYQCALGAASLFVCIPQNCNIENKCGCK